MGWWRRSLAGQLLVLLLAALTVSQVVAFLVFSGERRTSLIDAHQSRLIDSVATVARLMAGATPERRSQIAAQAASPDLYFWLTDFSVADPMRAVPLDDPLASALRTGLEESGIKEILVEIAPGPVGGPGRRPGGGWMPPPPPPMEDRGRNLPPLPVDILASIRLPGAQWLNVEIAPLDPGVLWALPPMFSALLAVLTMTAVVIFVVRRMNRPMDRLVRAADLLGRGEPVDPVPETGPEDIRRTARAFNRMNARLRRFLDDRTGMLAAISHDLRSPITVLRLKAEAVEDEALRASMSAQLDEMQQMVEGVLAFFREEATYDEVRTVDLAALAESVCEDLADSGKDASFWPSPRVVYPCRPVALKRAVRNLAENAIRYGTCARVAVRKEAAGPCILIDDDGPGLSDEDRERVFKPFVRLEDSRNRETGGTGLGLSIARTVARGHGGDIVLENRPNGGLRAVLRLPSVGDGEE